jgi:hypothetical protein
LEVKILFELNRKQDESFIDYCERLIDAKENNLIDTDKNEIWELLFGEKVSSDHARKSLVAVKKVISKIKSEGYEPISEEGVLKQIEIQKQELEKEKIKVRTEKLILTQALREEARFELFIEHTIDAIKSVKLININTNIINFQNLSNKSGLVLFADPHYGKELSIKGLYGETINEYSIEIFEKRMWKLLNKIVELSNKEGFNRISLLNLGDEIEGLLRVSQLMTLKMGVVDSAIAFSYFLASWLNELSKNEIIIDYYSTEGNHTDLRLLTGKKGDFPSENMSKVIQTLIAEILKDNPNVIIHKNNTDKIFTNIQGYNVLGIHGEEKNIMQAIRDFSFIYNTQIDYICTGHRHHANSINAGVNKGCIGVGSVIGIDDFSMQLKRVSNPSATFVVFEKDCGKTTEYTINLN